jgi:hypothetical protein
VLSHSKNDNYQYSIFQTENSFGVVIEEKHYTSLHLLHYTTPLTMKSNYNNSHNCLKSKICMKKMKKTE